jgi:hypothetical protein
MGNCSSTSNCNPCGPDFSAINQLATKAGAFARQANTYATNAENSWLEFNALYLGAFAVAPTVDNEGDPLQVGALYWNLGSNTMFAWNGTVWVENGNFDEFTNFSLPSATPVPAANLRTGQEYEIVVVGTTNWTAIGAPSAQVGVRFTKNAVAATGTGTARVTRDLVTRFADVVNVKDFGAVGDWNGIAGTNNITAFQNAMAAAAGKKLYIPSGRYLIEFTTGVCFNPPANIVIEGDGDLNTELIASPAGFTPSNFPVFFNLANQGIELIGIKFTSKIATGNNIILFSLSTSDVLIDGCTIDGSATDSGGTLSHSAYGITHGGNSSNISNNVKIQNSKFTRLTYPFLKDNLSTSISNNWEISKNIFTANYFDDIGLNSPNGIMNNVLISGNTLENNKSTLVGSAGLGVALATVTNVSITDNHFNGTYYDAIHIEENSDYISIEGNTFSINKGTGSSCKAIAFNANNVVGTEQRPNHISVIGNNMFQNGPIKDTNSFAIALVWNQFKQNPASEIVISNNTIKNFNGGINSVATLNDSIVITGNIIEDCEYGLLLNDGAMTVSNNVTKLCDYGIGCNIGTDTNESAVIRDHVFIDCNTNVFVTDASNIVVINPKFIFSEFNHTPTTTLKTLLPARSQDRIYGQLTMTIISGLGFTTGSAFDIEVITWDGTNLTWNDTSSLTPSATPVSRVNFESGFSLNASRTGTTLDVAVNNVTARDNCRLQVDLAGAAMIRV